MGICVCTKFDVMKIKDNSIIQYKHTTVCYQNKIIERNIYLLCFAKQRNIKILPGKELCHFS